MACTKSPQTAKNAFGLLQQRKLCLSAFCIYKYSFWVVWNHYPVLSLCLMPPCVYYNYYLVFYFLIATLLMLVGCVPMIEWKHSVVGAANYSLMAVTCAGYAINHRFTTFNVKWKGTACAFYRLAKSLLTLSDVHLPLSLCTTSHWTLARTSFPI